VERLKCLVVDDPVGPADLFRDPGRPLVNTAGDFRVERSPLEGVPQHGLGVGVLGIGKGVAGGGFGIRVPRKPGSWKVELRGNRAAAVKQSMLLDGLA